MPGCFGYGDIDSWMAKNLEDYLDAEYGDEYDEQEESEDSLKVIRSGPK